MLIEKRRRALLRAEPGADFLLRRLADDLADRLDAVERRFDAAAVLFGVTEHGADAVRRSGKAGQVTRLEAHPAFLGDTEGVVAAPETVPLPKQSLGLAVSFLALQDVDDVPGMLVQIRRALKPDGLFLAVAAGAGTLSELRESLLAAETEMTGGASPRVMPFMDVRDAGALLQRAGFALPVADIDTLTVRYDTMFALVRDLRAMGATNSLVTRSRRPATRALFARAAQIYDERFADPDGRVRATFSFVWLSGWAPDASQQKPAARGSATASLADALRRSDSETG